MKRILIGSLVALLLATLLCSCSKEAVDQLFGVEKKAEETKEKFIWNGKMGVVEANEKYAVFSFGSVEGSEKVFVRARVQSDSYGREVFIWAPLVCGNAHREVKGTEHGGGNVEIFFPVFIRKDKVIQIVATKDPDGTIGEAAFVTENAANIENEFDLRWDRRERAYVVR